MTLDEFKKIMLPDRVIELQAKLQNGEVIKVDIKKVSNFYAFKILNKTECVLEILAGFYAPSGVLSFTCSMNTDYMALLLDWAEK